jgi:hypothetical protein
MAALMTHDALVRYQSRAKIAQKEKGLTSFLT